MPCRRAGHVPAGSSPPHGCSQQHRDLLGPATSRGQPRKSAGCPDYRSTSLHRFAGIPPGPCRGSQKLLAKRPEAGVGLGLGWQESTSAGRASGQISLGLQTASRPAVHLCPAYRSGFWLGIERCWHPESTSTGSQPQCRGLTPLYRPTSRNVGSREKPRQQVPL